MRKLWRHVMPLSLMVVLPLLGIVYSMLNSSPVGTHSVVTDLDRIIPFEKAFVIPYLLWIPYLFLSLCYFYMKDKKVYYIALFSDIIGMLLCFVIYYFFQTSVVRPEITETDFLSILVQNIYARDLPTNCFPSIHCLSSFLMMKAINTSTFKNRWNVFLINIMGLSIIVSTLLIKQHALIDVLGASVLMSIVFAAVSFLYAKFFDKRRVLSIQKDIDVPLQAPVYQKKSVYQKMQGK